MDKESTPLHLSAALLPVVLITSSAQDKVAAEVTKVINDKNEEMVKGRADTAVGRNKTD